MDRENDFSHISEQEEREIRDVEFRHEVAEYCDQLIANCDKLREAIKKL